MYQNITIYIFFSKVYTQELQWNKWNKWNKDKTKQKLQLMRSLPRCPRDPITVRSSMNGGPNCIRKPLASKYQQSIGFLGQKNINKNQTKTCLKTAESHLTISVKSFGLSISSSDSSSGEPPFTAVHDEARPEFPVAPFPWKASD